MRNCTQLALILALVAFFGASAAGAGDAAQIEIGSSHVNGQGIRAYEARWSQSVAKEGQWAEMAVIEETASVEPGGKRDGSPEVLVHTQTTLVNAGPRITNTMRFERGTLRPMSLRQTIENGPEGSPPEVLFDFQDEAIVGTAKLPGGDKSFQVETEAPMFYGMTFGLVLAALPLEDGFEAELPASMPQGRTTYTVRARVVGKESFPGPGSKPVQAWAVETDWIDKATGEVSPGGADASGGTYYVVLDPPAGFPYVPKYANESIRIEMIP